MYNHAPAGYVCPICAGLKKEHKEDTYIVEGDFVYRDELVSVFVNSFAIGENAERLVVVPNAHFENVYDLPIKYGIRIMEVSRKMALALKKVYTCDAVTILQNNEPASEQHAFHYHMHVIPRHFGDNFHKHMSEKRILDPQIRNIYAERLKIYFLENQSD